VIFDHGDWVWVHMMRRERFPQQRKFKLQTRGDGPFHVLEKTMTMKVPTSLIFSSKYNVSSVGTNDPLLGLYFYFIYLQIRQNL